MPNYPEADATWVEQAEWCIDYYSRDERPDRLIWRLGQFLAEEWLRLIAQPEPLILEAQMLSRVIDAEREHQGSGWRDMSERVRNWVAELESHV